MAKKTIKCKIVNLTNIKEKQLEKEYNNLQEFIQLEKEDLDWIAEKIQLYSANRQQTLRFYKKVKDKEYPLSIRKDLLNIRKTNNKIAKYWLEFLLSHEEVD